MTDSTELPHVVIAGDPVDGFGYFGPFDTAPEALEWAERYVSGDWWIAPLAPPRPRIRLQPKGPPTMTETLSPEAREVLALCESEVQVNADASDVQIAADIAADIVQRLTVVYDLA